MTTDISGPDALRGVAWHAGVGSDARMLRALVVAAGLGCALLFVVVGLACGLQMYGDGSIFSYAVAVQDGFAFHWHNIAARLSVYVISLLPAETYVALTGDARGGIVMYGFLFFAAPLLGLVVTWLADRSRGRVIFTGACLSTACLLPIVFGCPTEMWMAHALFWPALALAHYAGRRIAGTALVFAALLGLVLTHEGAMIFALAILATLALRGLRDAALVRAGAVFVAVVAIWGAVKMAYPPDDYIDAILGRAAFNFIDIANLDCSLCWLLFATLAGYGVVLFALRHRGAAGADTNATVYAVAIVACALAVYWLGFDHALHTQYRYFVRTGLLIGTPVIGAIAALYALDADGRLNPPVVLARRLPDMLARAMTPRAAAGAILLVLLVHTVETAKFVAAWTDYKAAVARLAAGPTSDPALGDARFVSSDRIAADLNRLSWSSTTPYLSVLLAPDFLPARLVVEPHANYFWLSCRTATESEDADRAVPAASRRLVRVYSCLHR